MAELVVPGNNLLRLRLQPAPPPPGSDPTWDRQKRLYGDRGQAVLGQMRVAIVGLGGVGSILAELLARLGVGHLVLIAPELVDPTNLPRLVAARRCDALPWLRAEGRPRLLQRLGERLAARKVRLAVRNARRANRRIKLTVVRRDVAHPEAMTALRGCDWIFLAADSHLARHQLNAVVHQYVVPATQAGVKIPVDQDGNIGQIHAVMRLVFPGVGCLWCNGLIDGNELALETAPTAQQRVARYVEDVPAASVMMLNAVAAAEAANHFMLAASGLHDDDCDAATVIHRPRARDRDLQESRQDIDCRWCTNAGRLGLGDALELPMIRR